ncbi:hypothetical protein V6N13_002562 [Hibiscus sabdariffa]
MDGLQSWAKIELKRRGVQNLADAIAVAESLIDYSSYKESTPRPRDWKSVQAKGGGERSQRQESHRDDSPLRHKESSPWKGKMKATDSRNSRKPSSNNAGGTTRPIKARSASPAVGTSRPVLTVRRTGRPTPRSNYELFNCNNLNIRYWSWNYRGCWHQTCPPMDPR